MDEFEPWSTDTPIYKNLSYSTLQDCISIPPSCCIARIMPQRMNCSIDSAQGIMKTFKSGPFDVRFVITLMDSETSTISYEGSWNLSLSELLLMRFDMSWAAMNYFLAIISLFALVRIIKRRREPFSIFSILMALTISTCYAVS